MRCWGVGGGVHGVLGLVEGLQGAPNRRRGEGSSARKHVCATGKTPSGCALCLVWMVNFMSPHSAALAGSRERPHTKRMKAERCSGENLRIAAQK